MVLENSDGISSQLEKIITELLDLHPQKKGSDFVICCSTSEVMGGSMVVMSLDMYDRLTDNIESKLDEADLQAKTDPTRYTHEEVFSSIRNQIRAKIT